MKFNFSFLKSKKCILFFKISGSILIAIILLLLIAPSVININKYKDSILDKVNSNLNGSVYIEKLSLSLITGPKIKVKNFSLKDDKDSTIVSVDNLYFNIPLSSIIFLSPKIIVNIKSPDIKLVQNKNSLNVSNILKPSSTPTDKSLDTTKDVKKDNTTNDSSSKPKDNSFILNLILSSYYTLILDDASFSFTQDGKELIYLHDLSFVVKNLSLVKNSEFDISTNINFKKDNIFVQGPISILGKLNPNHEEKNYGISIYVNFKKLLYNISDILVKKGSDENSHININLNLNLATHLLKIENLDVILPDLSIQNSGEFLIKDMNLKLKNSITYKNKDSDISVNNDISIKDAKYNLVSNISSSNLNLNSFIPKKPESKSKSNADTTASATTDSSNSNKDSKSLQSTNKPISIQIPPIVKNISFTVKTNLKKLSYDKINVSNLVSNISLKNLNLSSKVSLNVFKSKITSDISAKLNSSLPYEAKTTVSSLDLKAMITSILPEYQNTLEGIFSLNNTTSGGISKDILATTVSSGNFSIEKPVISALDSREMLDKALNNAVEKIKAKYSYDISSLPKYGKYKESITKQKFESSLFTASFTLKDKKVVIPSFILKAVENKGIDINGNANINLANQDLLAQVTLIDTYNLTKASDLSIDKEGIVINNILTKEDKIFKVPVNIECKINAPCYKYDKSSKYLMDIVEDKSKAALKKKGKEVLKKEAEKLKKEFFFLK